MAKVIHIETTPNPDALKFILDQRIIASGARSFDDSTPVKDDALAKALFSIKEVRSVFYMDKFVTVTKALGADWTALQPLITEAIQSAAAPVEEPVSNAVQANSADDVLNKIHQVLDQNVRPALAGDGGGLEVLEYQDYVLTVHYQGACGSCPSATSGTLSAIQNLLQRLVDPRIQVVSC